MQKSLVTLALGGLMLCSSGLTTAAMAGEETAAQDYIGVNAGIANVINGKGSAMAGVEYRGAPLIWKVYPHAGGFVTHRGAVYGYAGVGIEVRLTDAILLRGNTAVGAYGQGDDRDLGHVIEFRSGVELAYELPNQAQIGLTFHHLSNAGLDSHNPGSEVATITYSMPLDQVF